jgi:hypothetical protein
MYRTVGNDSRTIRADRSSAELSTTISSKSWRRCARIDESDALIVSCDW